VSSPTALPSALPDPRPLAALGELFRKHVPEATSEIEAAVFSQIQDSPEHGTEDFERVVKHAVRVATRLFVDYLASPDPDPSEFTELFARLGALSARHGHSLDNVQSALRMSSQVACRRFIRDAYRFGWPKETLELVTDSLFALLGQAADVAARSYAQEQSVRAGDLHRRQERLRDLLVADPPPDRDAIAELAKAAQWPMPQTIAVVALTSGDTAGPVILPPHVLGSRDTGTAPYLVVPDPESAAGRRLAANLGRIGPAAIGPTVPVTQGALSRRWARRALDLVHRGVLPAQPAPRCADHTATLLAHAGEDLLAAVTDRRLGRLLRQNPRRRLPLVETLLAYLECGDSAPLAAARLGVHEQTVRYRLRRLDELIDPELREPSHRLDLMLSLSWLVRTSALD
jgi:DNA-binding NarL/FixJ family response regulator